jgi:hypothetical protein
MKELNYRVGSTIKYRNFGSELLLVVVESKEEDIKNGRRGFDGILPGGGGCWGYDSQIVEVVKF